MPSDLYLALFVEVPGYLHEPVSLDLGPVVGKDSDAFIRIPILQIQDVRGLRRHFALAELAVAFLYHMIDDDG